MAQLPQFPNLGGKFAGGQFSGSLGSLNLLSKLRRTYIVIVGPDAPQPELDNADAISSHMMQKLNFSKVLISDDAKLDKISKFANLILVGGPAANEWTYILNEYINPRYDITVLKERTEGQTWKEYVLGGGLQVNGLIINDTKTPGLNHTGILSTGKQTLPRIRPLQIMHVGGWMFEDTCCMTKAFLEDQEAGIYDTIWAVADPTYTKCPVDGNYKIKTPVVTPATPASSE